MLGHDGTLTEIQHLLICAGLFIWQPAREDSSARVTNPLLAYAAIAHATLSCSVPVYVAICRYVQRMLDLLLCNACWAFCIHCTISSPLFTLPNLMAAEFGDTSRWARHANSIRPNIFDCLLSDER